MNSYHTCKWYVQILWPYLAKLMYNSDLFLLTSSRYFSVKGVIVHWTVYVKKICKLSRLQKCNELFDVSLMNFTKINPQLLQ